MDANEILLDDRESARLLRMPRPRLKRLAKSGDVPCVILPDGEIRFRRDDLVAWVATYRKPAEGEVQS